MKWTFLKKCWPLPSRAAHRARRRKSQPAQPRARLWLEELESRTVPTTITRTSAAIFYNDFAPTSGTPLTSAYAAYQITNTDGVNYADVWATIGNFTAASGPVAVTLGTNAASAIDLGPLANGQTKTAFFYLGSNATTTVNQTHTVSVFNGPPTSGSLLTSQNFSFAAVLNTINASSNKVNSVIVSPSSPTVGGTFTITVTGATGEIGAANVLDFTPAAYSSWRADALQLIGTTITLSGGNTGTFSNTLVIPPGSIMSAANTNYTAVYTFQVVGTTATSTVVSPVAYISSGGNVKHTDTGNFATLPPSPPPQLDSPTLTTTPTPATVTLGTTSVTLKDTADLENGFRPTGAITFTLVAPGGATVDTETVTVNGNGIYTTPTGFTLPATGTVTGTYQWNATYRGDTNNNAASDNNDPTERVTVSAASPTLATTPGQRVITLGVSTVTLTDTALLSDGYNPTGTITFTLVGLNGTTVDTEIVAVNGNGTYTTPTGYTIKITGSTAGTYQWNATYSGNNNNNSASDNNNTNEQVTINKADPTITTTPSPTTVTLGTSSVRLTDTADLEGGSNPTGTITFMLVAPGGGTVDTETVPVSGNGIYTTPTGFVLSAGAATGTYQWNARYSGDNNDDPVSNNNDPNERVTVSAASPTLATAPSPDTVTLGATAPPILTDSAILAGGFNPTGTITFTLFQGVTLLDTETVTVSGNGTYTTPTGFSLPSTGTVTGTYQWNATYSGDPDNTPLSDVNDPTERVTVSAASPTLSTTPSPNTLAVGVTLKDTAFLGGGFHPRGTIIFTLIHNNITVDTETVTVNGNGAYTTPTGFAPGTASGTYQWNAVYSGDANNNIASDVNDPTEQVTVIVPAVTLSTTPIPATVILGATPVTLNDTADLEGGLNPTGTITFTLFQGVTLLDTETVTVNGDGIYRTPTGFTLLSTGTATGTYQWNATYSGDSNNGSLSDNNNPTERVTVSTASPTIATIPVPDTVTLGSTPVTLADVAQLVNGFNPTGTITFTLFQGSTLLDTETVTVSGNGTYRTPTGFTLPSSGTATGTYQWDASYSGDANNDAASDVNNVNEQVTVSAARATLSTNPSPTTVTLGAAAPPILTDVAVLGNGFNPTGTITFTLFHNGGSTPVDTETVAVSGNGRYTTPTGFTLPGTSTATGTYQWDATYSGDTNNNAASDNDDADEQVTVRAASPTIVTIANPTGTITLGTTSPTLNDTAVVAGGYHPSGTLLFTLKQGNTTVFTQTDTVTGNGTYTTAGFTLPTTGTVTGTYTWTVAYSGDGNNNAANDRGGATEQTVVSAASPTLTTTPNVTTITLGAAVPPLLTDTADLEGGFNPTGDITFELFRGSTLVHTEMVAASGNGTYMTPTGFTLPTTGAVAGTYQWVAVYGGDDNNGEVSDSNPAAEQVTVNAASPTLVTTASPTTLTLPAPVPTFLTDTADLTGGFNPGGTIVFTLTGPGGFSDTQTDTVSGNGSYMASTTLPTTGTVAGTYSWTANYEGDANNAAATDQGGAAEQTVVSPASLTLVTIASPNVTLPTGPPGTVTLSDAAFLSGGQSPTGNIVFTLTGPRGFSFTEDATVSGNGTYSAQTTLPTTVTVAGTYTWKAAYSGDGNNSAANDQGGIAEQTVVSPASPTLVTTASPLAITLGTTSPTLNDTALLAGGYNPTGTLLFTLMQGGATVFTQTDAVTGNGTYTTAGFTLPTAGTVAGTYTWTVAYSGDGNNNAANDQGGATEQTVVSPASPTLVTTASPAVTLPTGPPGTVTLSDSALLSGGYFPIGNMVFTLTGSGGFSQSQTDTVSGNGSYTASITLPTTGTVAGTYTWSVAYGGDGNNSAANDQGGIAEQTVVSAASPTLTTTPNVTTITLGVTVPPILTDTATLSGGFNPTGDIAFELFQGSTLVDTETVTVNGNGAYTTPTGFTLPTTGAVAGAYQWVAVYSGDDNNVRASDNDPASEQVTVSAASPTLTTAPNVTTVTLGATAPPILTDTADLEGGFNPTGDITFELFQGSTLVHTEMVAVSGNGSYTTPTGFTLPTTGAVAGAYQWVAVYSGDDNNGEVSESNPTEEQVEVLPASPTLVTTASPSTVTLPAPVPTFLTDTADLTGGFNPTGNVVFTLTGPGGFSFTETDTVSGNGSYTASTTLPTTGTVVGTYTWTADYEGDANNNGAADQGGTAEQVTVSAASPTLTTSPNVTTVTLGATAPPILTDTADLEGGFDPTGDITFELFRGSTLVHTEMVAVSGNGAYTTPTGFTLPTTGTVAGTYEWVAIYTGDDNNGEVSDSNPAAEQVEVLPASPTLVTTASPTTVALPVTGGTLTDSADLEGGFNPTGSIVFTLTGPGGFSYTQTDTVNGNATYSATLPTALTTAGTYTWTADYSGDANNAAATDQGGTAEQTVVGAASLTLVTIASPNVTLPTGPVGTVTLSDSAFLSGGQSPTGTIVFTLTGPGGFSYTQTDTVSDNGTYSASTVLPTTGTVAGTYTWSVAYGGDGNNNAATDQGGIAEQTLVSPASPTLVTTASPDVTLPAGPPGTVTLSDSALLSGGYYPGGSIVFTLTDPGGFSFTQTDSVSGNGTYTANTTLPTTGTLAGTYTWTADYQGDNNNNGAADQGGIAEQTVVSAASPTLVTIASPNVTLPAGPPGTVTLRDAAFLSGGQSPTGTIVFTLTGPGGFSFTEDVTVNGNGAYTASTTLLTTGTVAGTYTWTALYGGDGNNAAATDQGGIAEQTVVGPARPAFVTIASPAVTLPTGPPGTVTLRDAALLLGGYFPTGNIVFTLTGPGGFSYTQTDTVNGNGSYTASTTLPTTVTVAGTYTWTAAYSGDANNAAANDQSGIFEQTVVRPARPTIVTTASPDLTLPTGPPGTVTLRDAAFLSRGYFPTGTITFTLMGPGSFSYTQTDMVSGNGSYTASTTLPTTGTVTGTYTWTVAYGGDNNNNSATDQGGAAEQVTVSAASPTLTTAPNLTTITLGATAPPLLTDTADLEGGFDPTGDITFELFRGSTLVHTELVAVSGNGAYTTPTGFTLPTTGAVAGTYQWVAVYGGDGNNGEVSDSNAADERVTVNPASPTLLTTASPTTLTLPAPVPTFLTDTADLTGGFNPGGTIAFTLTGPGGFSFTEDVAVSGNGAYTASTTLPTTGTVAGTYTWTANYEGDANNSAATDQGGTAEQTVVGAASLTLVTIASPNVTLPAGPPRTVTLSDAALLSGGQSPTGNIVFTLTGPNGFLYTQTDPVSGNGTYSASTALPTTGTVAGTYTWTALYGGDGNNSAANDQGGIAERTVVSPASPTLVTTASPLAVTLGTTSPTLNDTALLAGGYHPSGTLLFTLKRGGATVFTQSDAVTGNGTYTTAGFTLPTAMAVTGTYTWTVAYSGDGNNNAANDQAGATEQTVVSPASPTLVTTASQAVTLVGATTPTLTDSAVLSSGYFPTGSIVFTLTGPNSFSFMQTDTVSGNGTYSASTTLPATVAGLYTWMVTYGGDTNNNTANDQGGAAEQAIVAQASPTLTTTPSPTTVTLDATAPPPLTDSATLAGGSNPTGTITFTLVYNNTTVDTETVSVSGNGPYTTPNGFTLPSSGTVTGTYQWDAIYSGDSNNNAASDDNDATEQVTVSAASPTLSTTPNPSMAHLGVTLQDVADLAGGFDPTGSITFRLYAPGVDPTVGPATYTETVTGVNGNGAYHTTVGFAPPATGIWHWVATYNGDPNNNLAPSGPLAEPVTIPPQADLALAKTVNDPTPNVGETVTFTVALTNLGPDTATNVSVADVLPAGLTLLGAAPSQGSYAGGVWTVGTVAPSAVPTLTLTALVVSSNAETNSATVSHSDQFDPDPSNNSASATVAPQQADLVLVKSVNNPQPVINTNVTFTFLIGNKGPSTATGVIVSDPFPAGLAVVSFVTPSQGTYNPATGVWQVGTLAPGAIATLQVVAQVQTLGPLLNTATAGSVQIDPDLSNNTSSVSLTGMMSSSMMSKRFFLSLPFGSAASGLTPLLAPAQASASAASAVASRLLGSPVLPSSSQGIQVAGGGSPALASPSGSPASVRPALSFAAGVGMAGDNPGDPQTEPGTAGQGPTSFLDRRPSDAGRGTLVSEPAIDDSDTAALIDFFTDTEGLAEALDACFAFWDAGRLEEGVQVAGLVNPDDLFAASRPAGWAGSRSSLVEADWFDGDFGAGLPWDHPFLCALLPALVALPTGFRPRRRGDRPCEPRCWPTVW